LSFTLRRFTRFFTFLACFLLLLNGKISAQDEPSETATQIVFGIEKRISATNQYSQSIVLADLKHNKTEILVPQIAPLSYKPSPDKHYLAYAQVLLGKLARCEIRDLWADAALIYTGGIGQQCIPLWSGDSQKMVMALELGDTWTAQIWDLKAHHLVNTTLQFKASTFGSWQATYSPDGSKMFFEIPLRDGLVTARLLDLKTGIESSVPAPFETIDWTPFWSPTGKQIALVATPRNYEWQTVIYEPSEHVSHWLSDDWIPIFMWSPDGKYLAYLAGGFHTIRLLDDRNNDTKLEIPDGEDLIYEIVWIADRDSLVAVTGGKKGTTFWRVDVTKREWTPIFAQPQYMQNSVSPDHRYMWVVYRIETTWRYAIIDLLNSETQVIPTLTINRPYQNFWSQDNRTICWVVPINNVGLPKLMLLTSDIKGKKVHQYLVDDAYNAPGCESGDQYLANLKNTLPLDQLALDNSTEIFAPLEVRQS
jgi:WD40 repeat protein